jgi:hypothetical protein
MTYFKERQHIRQPIPIAIILALAAVGWGSLIQQVVRGKPVGDNPLSDWGVVVLWLLIGVGLPLVFFWAHLETTVEDRKLILRMKPVTAREIYAGQIARFYARTYKPLREYGGWGIKGFCSNRAYNMSGNQGVQLELVDGQRVLIGSQRPQELEAAIATMTGRPPERSRAQ